MSFQIVFQGLNVGLICLGYFLQWNDIVVVEPISASKVEPAGVFQVLETIQQVSCRLVEEWNSFGSRRPHQCLGHIFSILGHKESLISSLEQRQGLKLNHWIAVAHINLPIDVKSTAERQENQLVISEGFRYLFSEFTSHYDFLSHLKESPGAHQLDQNPTRKVVCISSLEQIQI